MRSPHINLQYSKTPSVNIYHPNPNQQIQGSIAGSQHINYNPRNRRNSLTIPMQNINKDFEFK